MILLRRRSGATRGYLGFTTACAIGFGILAWLSDGALPASPGAPVVADPAWDAPRRAALVGFCLLATAALVARRARPGAGEALEWAALAAAAATLVAGALAWGGGAMGTVSLLTQLAVVTASIGGVFAAMLLGHWYLVTPKLPEAPLILLARVLLVVVAVQVVLFWAWIATGAGPADVAPFAALVGPYALFVWLRLIVGLVFPLIVVVGVRPDGQDPVDGVRDRPPVHQRRLDRRRDHPRCGTLFRSRSPGLTVAEDSMGKDDRSWIPGVIDLEWIDSLAPALSPALAAIEAAAAPLDIPIVDRDSGRVLQALAGGRRRIVEVGTAYGYSTLWMALGQPPDGTIVTIDPDRSRTDLARGWWREAGIADERITVVNAPALEAFEAGEPALAGPFDLAFIDALKPEYLRYLGHIAGRLAPGALVVADNVLWSGRVSGSRPADAGDANTAALREFDTAVLGDRRFNATILPVGDGLLIASWLG